MNKIYANKCDAICLGRQGENLATQVIFDLSDWIFGYGIGTAELIAQRAGDEKPYPVSTDRQGNQLIWAVSDFDTESATSYGRSGRCELRYYVGDILVKSRTWQTTVSKAMDTPSSTRPPAADQGWVEQVLATGVAAKASADAAKADADRASALAAQAAVNAAQTAQDASDAAKAMEAAQTAQRLAEEAQGAAETARTAAAAAQAAAETAATDAAGAKQAAEAALKATQDAAAAAAKALADIRALYQEMQTWAQGVIQDVNDAGSVAVRSVQTAGDTQVQRVTAEGTRQTANAKAQADAAAQSASGAAQSAQEAAGSASAASTSKTNAKASEESAKASETAAQASQTAAAGSASAAANSATSASASASAASESASAAAASATAAKASEEAAKASETAAKASETAAAGSASAAQQSATSAAESAAVYDTVVADVNQLKQDITAITPDDTTVDGKPWTSKKIVDSLCMPIEESGNPVQCYPVENYPLGVKVSWEPTQEGSGDPSPDNIRPITGRDAVSVTRCGKNICDYDITIEDVYYLCFMHSRRIELAKMLKMQKGTYFVTIDYGMQLNDAPIVYIKSKKNTVVARISNGVFSNTGATGQIILEEDDEVLLYAYKSTVDFTGADNSATIQIELGSTATPYEPYTGDTYNIDLPETVYGGTLDVETGVVTVEYGHIASYAGEPLPGEWISDRDVYAPDATPTTGAQVAYKLAEPRTIQLTPQQIAALSGTNTLYTDADGVVVTGAEDPKHTITELKNAIISLGGNI